MADRASVSPITDDMVEAAAKALYDEVAYQATEWDDARVREQDVFRQHAKVALSAALAGYTEPTTDTDEDAAVRMARARQWMAHEGGARSGMPVPTWEGLTPTEQEQAELEARHWIQAAVNTGVKIVPAGYTVVALPAREPDPPNVVEAAVQRGIHDYARAYHCLYP